MLLNDQYIDSYFKKLIGDNSTESDVSQSSTSQDTNPPSSSSQLSNIEPSTSQDTNLSSSSSKTTGVEPSLQTKSVVPIDDKVYQEEESKYIHSFSVQEKDCSRRHVYCKVCAKYPDIVRRYCENRKPPTIATTVGIRFRKDYMWAHFMSAYHKKCKEAEQAEQNPSSINRGLMNIHIKEANRK